MHTPRGSGFPTGYTFILWGPSFDESAAIVFATTLRRDGLCVKLVGVNRPYAVGQNGITLQSDLSITDMVGLMDQTICVVVPCNYGVYQRIAHDPRLHEFFAGIAHSAVPVVIHESIDLEEAGLLVAPCRENLYVYANDDELMRFARQIRVQLWNNWSQASPVKNFSH